MEFIVKPAILNYNIRLWISDQPSHNTVRHTINKLQWEYNNITNRLPIILIIDEEASVTTSFKFTTFFNCWTARFNASFSIQGDFPPTSRLSMHSRCTMKSCIESINMTKWGTLQRNQVSHSAHLHSQSLPSWLRVTWYLTASTATILQLLGYSKTSVHGRRRTLKDKPSPGICSLMLL